MSTRSSILVGSFLTLIFLVTSCGGGGGGSSGSSSSTEGGGAGASGGVGSALSVAESVSVVDAQSSTSSSLSGLMKAAVGSLPSTSDYVNDEIFTHVEEQSADALDVINEIFCMISQTGYQDMINLGDYLAQIDMAQCDKENDDVAGKEGSDGSSGGNVPEYEFWTVNSYRLDDDSPHVVAAWIHMNGNEFEPAEIIQARFNVFEEPSDSNPYGIISGYFKATLADTGEESFNGYIISELQDDGSVVLKFYNSFGEAVALTRDGSTIAGNAEINKEDGSFSYQFAANDDYFYRQSGGEQGEIRGCMSRTQYDETTNRYNLYDNEIAPNPGGRVGLNSGFSAVFIDPAGERHHGWVGFYGTWFPDVSPESGATVYKQTFESGAEPTETPYTLFKSGGKLKKKTLETLALSDMGGIPLYWHDCSATECTEYVVEWNKTTQTLNKIATVNEDTHIREELATSQPVTFASDDWNFNGWSESFGGDVMIELRNNSTNSLITLTNTTPVIFHREEVVMPGDTVPANLYCFENCPDPSKIDTDSPYFIPSTWESGSDTFVNRAQSVAPSKMVANTHYVPYIFDTTNMVLKYGTSAVTTSGASQSESGGIWTNYLIEPTTANLAAITCPWSSKATCPWQAFTDVSVMYTYETGDNEWNRLSLLQDPTTGTFLEFDQPINIEYTHADNGNTYFLNYGGPGDLWGIPGKCVDISNGSDVNCGDWEENSPIRWVSEFSILDGSIGTDATGRTFYIKGTDKEQRMIGVDESECINSGLTFTTLDVPQGEDYQDPDIGDEPDLGGQAPAVIAGVLQ